MKKKIAIFDIDGTIFRKNLHFELIDELAWMNIFPRKVRNRLVELYTEWLEHKGTYEAYRRSLIDLYANHIKKCRKEDVIRASKYVVPFYANRTYVFAEDLIKKLKKINYHLIAISGSPIEIVEEYNRQHLKFDQVFGSVYKIDERGFYTGELTYEPVKDKGGLVKQYIFEKDLMLDESYGIGDTESDANFLELVEHAIAFNPNHNLLEIAKDKNWEIVVEKKDVVYNIN
jgi:HAD superfamily phosphoserine phosphatase-like hydrolase